MKLDFLIHIFLLAIIQIDARRTLQDYEKAAAFLPENIHSLTERLTKTVGYHISSPLEDLTRRKRQFSWYQTFEPLRGNSFDAGPLTACSKPTLPGCEFPPDYLIPAYKSATLPSIVGKELAVFLDLLGSVTTSLCLESVRDLLCQLVANPRCLDGKAKFFVAFREKCMEAMGGCPTTQRIALVNSICSNPQFSRDPILSVDAFQDYPLDSCKQFGYSFCDADGTSPSWMVAEQEARMSQAFSLTTLRNTYIFNTKCVRLYYTFFCTLPTCTEKDRMAGFKTQKRCESVISNCGKLLSEKQRNALRENLMCDAFDKIRIRSEWKIRKSTDLEDKILPTVFMSSNLNASSQYEAKLEDNSPSPNKATEASKGVLMCVIALIIDAAF